MGREMRNHLINTNTSLGLRMKCKTHFMGDEEKCPSNSWPLHRGLRAECVHVSVMYTWYLQGAGSKQ